MPSHLKREAKTKSVYGRSAEEKQATRNTETAYRNPRETRRNRGPMVLSTFIRPHIPKKFWKGDRPSWGKPIATLRQEVIAARGTNICAKAGCNAIGDEIDHRVDWRTYIYRFIDPTFEIVPGGIWTGYLLKDVRKYYDDVNNLQMMCQHHNGSKSGPKFYDRDRPTFMRRKK